MKNGYDNNKKQNKYIDQLVDKVKFFRLRSPAVCFEIYENDLDDELIKQKEIYIQGCKNEGEKYIKLNGIFTEVIARIDEQAKPRILAESSGENIGLERSLNEIRELVSLKWTLINKDGINNIASTGNIKKQNHGDSTASDKEKITLDIDKKEEYSYYKYSQDISPAESILMSDIPMFLQIKNGEPY
jgi:hypothetical protein